MSAPQSGSVLAEDSCLPLFSWCLWLGPASPFSPKRGSCGPDRPAVYMIFKCSSSQDSLLGEVNKWFMQLCSSQTQTAVLQSCGSVPWEECQERGRITLIVALTWWPGTHRYHWMDTESEGKKEGSTERRSVSFLKCLCQESGISVSTESEPLSNC